MLGKELVCAFASSEGRKGRVRYKGSEVVRTAAQAIVLEQFAVSYLWLIMKLEAR